MIAVDTTGKIIEGEPPKLESNPIRKKIEEIAELYDKPAAEAFGPRPKGFSVKNYAIQVGRNFYSQYMWPYRWAKGWWNTFFPETNENSKVEGYPLNVPDKLADDWVTYEDVPDLNEYEMPLPVSVVGSDKKKSWENYASHVHFYNKELNTLDYIDKNLKDPKRSTFKKLAVDIPSGLVHIPISLASKLRKDSAQIVNDPIGYVWRDNYLRNTAIHYGTEWAGDKLSNWLYHSAPPWHNETEGPNITEKEKYPLGFDWNNKYLSYRGNHTDVYTKAKARQFTRLMRVGLGQNNNDELRNAIIEPLAINRSYALKKTNWHIKDLKEWFKYNQDSNFRHTTPQEVNRNRDRLRNLHQDVRDINEKYGEDKRKAILFYWNVAEPTYNEFQKNRNIANEYAEKNKNDRLAKKLEQEEMSDPSFHKLMSEGAKGAVTYGGGGGGGSSVWSTSWRRGRKKTYFKKYAFNGNRRGKVKHYFRRRGYRSWIWKR